MKLKLQFFGQLIWSADSFPHQEKTLMLGKSEGKRRRGPQRKRWLDSITDTMDLNLSKLKEIVEDKGAWSAAVHGVTKSETQLSKWTTVNGLMETHHRGSSVQPGGLFTRINQTTCGHRNYSLSPLLHTGYFLTSINCLANLDFYYIWEIVLPRRPKS